MTHLNHTPVLHKSIYSSRADLGRILSDLNLVGEAVEVGVYRGEFSTMFLSKWHGRMLHCIDPWEVTPYFTGNRQDDFERARRKLDFLHPQRWKPMKATSPGATSSFADGSLDFVYIDADHNYQPVLEDLGAWWPKLKTGGMMAGHDFVDPMVVDGGWGRFVQPAVFDFCASIGVRAVYMICETDNSPWSFYFFKGQPMEV